MNTINENIFNLHNSPLDNDNRYKKDILQSKLIRAAR